MKKNSRVNLITAIIMYVAIISFILCVKGMVYKQNYPVVTQNSAENINKTDNYEEEFNKYKEEFKEKYDIDLLIYDENDIPYTDNMTFEWVEMDEKLMKSIKEMEKTLLRYPEGMLKREIKYNSQKNIFKKEISIYLVSNIYSQGRRCVGYTIHRVPERDIIFIDVFDNEVSYTLSHEIFHIIQKKGMTELALYFNPTFSAKNWEKHNPQDFSYSERELEDNIKYLLGKLEEIYFVTSYSKTSRDEDMAETFAAMMSYEEDNIPDSFYSPHVINKMRFISEFLEENYESATEDAYWNRWLNSLEESAN